MVRGGDCKKERQGKKREDKRSKAGKGPAEQSGWK